MQIVQTDYKHTLPSLAYRFVKGRKKKHNWNKLYLELNRLEDKSIRDLQVQNTKFAHQTDPKITQFLDFLVSQKQGCEGHLSICLVIDSI